MLLPGASFLAAARDALSAALIWSCISEIWLYSFSFSRLASSTRLFVSNSSADVLIRLLLRVEMTDSPPVEETGALPRSSLLPYSVALE